jgi:hypothetical protein
MAKLALAWLKILPLEMGLALQGWSYPLAMATEIKCRKVQFHQPAAQSQKASIFTVFKRKLYSNQIFVFIVLKYLGILNPILKRKIH